MSEEKRVIKLDLEQAKEIRLKLCSRKEVGEIVASMLQDILKTIIEEEMECWEEIYQLAGVSPETHHVIVSHICNEITVTPRKDKP